MRAIPKLSSFNCFLMILHSMNIRLMLDGLKDREGRSRKSSRNWIVFVSANKDVAGPLKWVSDPDIKPGYIYVVAYITGYEEGVDFKYNWKLEIYPVTRPVKCPPVGQGPQSPRAAHAIAMAALGLQLNHMQISGRMSSSSTRVWTFAEDPTAFVNWRGSAKVPVWMVQCFTSVQHATWTVMCTAGSRMWYEITAKDPSMEWGYQEGTKHIQVKVLGHMYIKMNGVRFSLIICEWARDSASEGGCLCRMEQTITPPPA